MAEKENGHRGNGHGHAVSERRIAQSMELAARSMIRNEHGEREHNVQDDGTPAIWVHVRLPGAAEYYLTEAGGARIEKTRLRMQKIVQDVFAKHTGCVADFDVDMNDPEDDHLLQKGEGSHQGEEYMICTCYVYGDAKDPKLDTVAKVEKAIDAKKSALIAALGERMQSMGGIAH